MENAKEGFPIMSLREIMRKRLNNKNIISLIQKVKKKYKM
jgi:hypothetical protein